MNIEWDIFRLKLKLNEEQAILIKYILNRLKNQFAEMCEIETVDHGMPPIEFFAALKENNQELDDKSLENKFIDYLSRERELDSGLTYFQGLQKICLSTHNEVVRLLKEEQQEALHGLEIKSVFEVNTGYDPLLDKITQQVERNKKIKKNNMNTFCTIPFEYAQIDDTGDVYPCCPSKFKLVIGNLSANTLHEIWNSKAALAVRKSIINRTFRYCDYEACEYLKEGEIKQNENITKDKYKDLKLVELNSMDTVPKIINLSYDRSCNLACPTCRVDMYRPQMDDNESTARIHHNIFDSELHGTQRLIISGNGDPFASRIYMDLLRNFDQKKYPDVKIKIQTNGLLLTPKKWNSIEKSHAAIDWITVSIDAATEETYKINRGGNFGKLLKNLEFIGELKKNDKIKLFFINFVVQANNYKEIKPFIDLGLKYGCDLIEFQCIENWGTYSPKAFKKVAVHMKSHPEHKEFLKVLNDPILADPAVCTYKLLEFMPGYIKKKIGKIGVGAVVKYEIL